MAPGFPFSEVQRIEAVVFSRSRCRISRRRITYRESVTTFSGLEKSSVKSPRKERASTRMVSSSLAIYTGLSAWRASCWNVASYEME